MKRKFMALAGVLVLGALLGAPLAVRAHGTGDESNFRSGDTVSIAKDETVKASAYLAGGTVTVAGVVQGDLYCAGQNINITGRVEGDVICAGQTVTVSGTVIGDVRLAGQTVNIDGPVGKNATAFGQNITVNTNSVVNGDATLFGSVLQLNGKIGRDATFGGQTATVAGTIGRNANVTDEQLTLTSGAKITGTLEYTSENPAAVDKGATVGAAHRHEPETKSEHTAQNDWATKFGMAAYWFGATLVFGLVLLAMVPRTLKASSDTMLRQGGWALLAGLAVLIATPMLAAILAATVIGIPLAITLFILWLSGLVAAFAYAGYSAGQWIAEQTKWKLKWPRVTYLVTGLLVLWLCMLVPVVGGLVGFLALVWGLGGMMLAFGAYMKGNKTSAATATKKAKA